MGRAYRFFPHTADVGAEIRAATLRRLFEGAARAMFDLVCDRRTVRPRRAARVSLRGASPEDLLVRWLTDLLYRHETRGLLFSSFRVERLDRRRLRLHGTARGEPIDRARHIRRREVKAVTYHDLRIRRGPRGWSVRLVFDV